jgi:hypothetical protein
MPMHDWTRVSASTFHDFHNSWITHIKESLNEGILPSPYYAQGEQRLGDIAPDVLALRASEESIDEGWSGDGGGIGENSMVAVEEVPPQVKFSQEALNDLEYYLSKQRTVVIRRSSGDRVVALIEIVSPANKHTRHKIEDFADKVVAALREGIHVLIIDPFPPTHYDPDGIHGYIWHKMLAGTFHGTSDQPLTLVSYTADEPLRAYVEPLKIGDLLAAMPLLLKRGYYVNVPLEQTYQQTWAGVPQRWQRVVEGGV